MKYTLIMLITLTLLPSIGFSLTLQDVSIEAMIRLGLTRDQALSLGSGDIVGNGGGKAEADFNYAYRKVYKFINDCTETYKCHVNNEQKEILNKIKMTALRNLNKSDKLIFVNEHTVPGFFNDEFDPQTRIAKTGFTPDSPIFVNLDLIYNHSLKLLDIPSIVAILIHEIGHQTGIKEHQILDDLGSRVRNFLNEEKLQVKISIADNFLKIIAFNFKSDDVNAELNLNYRGHNVELGSRIFNLSKCTQEGTRAVGYRIENIYFERVTKTDYGDHKVPMRAWLTLNCKDNDSVIWKEERDLKIGFEIQRRSYPPYPPEPYYSVENVSILVQ
jgi:hypothetical protein